MDKGLQRILRFRLNQFGTPKSRFSSPPDTLVDSAFRRYFFLYLPIYPPIQEEIE